MSCRTFSEPVFQGAAGHDRIVVAMSGGVDSSVAALLLKEQGKDVVGISMQVWDYRGNGGARSRATCCAPDDFNDARRVAAHIGIPYYVFDFENIFRKEVIDRFVASYRDGITPNPCVDCNNKVKFRELRTRAMAFGGTHIATGHYARITKQGDGFVLQRGADAKKDQSYFLYGLTQAELANTIFPVGHLSKAEVRECARRAGLGTAEKSESQDICFVSGSVREFVARLGGPSPAGRIVDRHGKILGSHDGIEGFTVGQRRGLRIGGVEAPLYVLEIDASANSVVVGTKEELERDSFEVQEINWQSPEVLRRLQGEKPIEIACRAQLRYRHTGVPVKVRIDSGDTTRARVVFSDQWSAVSPGQAAVFYDDKNETVLGGGRIARDDRAPTALSSTRAPAATRSEALAILE